MSGAIDNGKQIVYNVCKELYTIHNINTHQQHITSVQKGGYTMIKTASFIAICLYYYMSQAFRSVTYAMMVLWLAFIIHKLVSWGLWVLSF